MHIKARKLLSISQSIKDAFTWIQKLCEVNACHVRATKISYVYISFYFFKSFRLGCNMKTLEVYYTNLLFLWYH